MKKIINSALDIVGNTPILKADRYKKSVNIEKNDIYAKLEYLNPAGSVKDRVGVEMICDAQERGLIKPGDTIIEATSGNTGIGLAVAAAIKGYRTIIVLPETMSVERRKLLKAYGAELILTPGEKGMKGSVEKAEELHREIEGSIIASQFENPANPLAHKKTTGPEIWEQMEGKVDIFIAGIGTGGTITGVGEYLKEKNKKIQIIGVEPKSSPLLTEGRADAHKIQGIGANFVPKNLNKDILDEVIAIEDDEAYEEGRRFAKVEGLLVGISSGAALKAAAMVANRPENEGKNIVVLLPDSGDRYLSTDMFEG